jgi:hemerythrin
MRPIRIPPEKSQHILPIEEESAMNTYVTWKDFYSVGEHSLDAQHRQILSILNDLYGAMDAGREYDEIKRLLDSLLRYTMTHFAHEEYVMRACGYPDFDNHKAEHDQMRRRTAGLRTNVNLVTGRDLLSFLKDWWCNHIQSEDQCYVPYVSAAAQQLSGAAT